MTSSQLDVNIDIEPNFREAADKIKSEMDAQRDAHSQVLQGVEGREAEQAQLVAEQEDPRNKENWGAGGVVKELQSAFLGGLQDTASSVVTAPERLIDLASGEMTREAGTEAGYTAEWDDMFVDDANPIETKTWWGGLIRSATHFGSLGLAIVKAAPVAAVGATAVGAGRAVSAIGGVVANQWARAAAVGATTDLVSKYSQDANALQILRDRYGFMDTPLTTNDWDHPVVKTFKNVVEGMGIGELTNGVFRVMGKTINRIKPGKRVGEEIVTDATEDAIAKGDARTKSVDDQIIEKGREELIESPTEFRGHKNKPIADSWQGAPTSKDNPMDVRNSQRRIRRELGAEEGSPGSVTTPAQLARRARTADLDEQTVTEIFKDLVSEPRFLAEVQAVRSGRQTMKQVWGDAIEQFQRTGLGREAADIAPEQYLAEYYQGAHKYFADTPDEMVAWTSKNVVAGDLLVGSLFKEIRDLGLVGRELFEVADVGDIDAPAKALYDKLITAVTEVKRSRIIQSDEFRNLQAGSNRRQFVKDTLQEQVNESIDGFKLAMKVACESDNEDLFKAIFEIVSMTKEIENLTDFDNWIRTKLRGGNFKGNKTKNNLLIREWERVFINSILSGPKTAARAIIGTSTASFLRPFATAIGAGLRYPFTGDGATIRASLSSINAMREAIPEAWTLFKTKLNSYWAGDIATVKSRFTEYTKGDQKWEMFGHR